MHGYARQSVDKIFSGKAIDPKRLVPFFGTREKGAVLACSGVRLFLFEDPATRQREVKPDPNGKVMYKQGWARRTGSTPSRSRSPSRTSTVRRS